MKLKKVIIKNFKSIENIEITLDEKKTLIIGKNNCGKSNFLEILNIILKPGSSSYDLPSFRKDLNKDEFYYDASEPIEVYLTFNLGTNLEQYPKEITVYSKKDNTLDISFIKEYGKDGEFIIGDITVNYPEYVKTARFIYFNCIMLSAVRGYNAIKDISNPIYSTVFANIIRHVCNKYKQEIESKYNLTEEKFSEYFCNLLSNFFNKELFVNKAIQDFKKITFYSRENIMSDIKQITKYNTEIDSEKVFGKLYIMVDDGKEQELTLKGMGVQSIFLVNLILHANKFFAVKPIICIDEVELHLHPQAQRRFNDILSEISQENQVIITTHSPLFIKEMDIFNVILLKKTSATTGYQLPEDCDLDKKTLKRELNEFNSEMLFANAVILVEGLSDKIILKHLANRCMENKYNLDINNISIINVNSKNNMKFYSKLLDYFKIPYYIVLDLDGIPTANEILESKNIKTPYLKSSTDKINYLKKHDILVLEKGEIEDYYPISKIKEKFKGIKDVDKAYSENKKMLIEESTLDIILYILSKFPVEIRSTGDLERDNNTNRQELKKSYDKAINLLRDENKLSMKNKHTYEILESLYGPIGKPKIAMEITELIKEESDMDEDVVNIIKKSRELSMHRN